jgi:ABC-type amino acid transport substrate-binding protein
MLAFAWGCSAGKAPSSAVAPSTLAPATDVAGASGGRAGAPASRRALTELRVGTSGDYAPFSRWDDQGSARGFDVELAMELARDIDVELRWVPFRWPDLKRALEGGDFDLAMGGVTWQPSRAVLGYMTRAVARGGPCVLGDPAALRVAVNRGGVLEAWARGQFSERELVIVDDNMSLPLLLAEGRVGAIVTDSFERKAFERPGWASRCEPALSRKVYWVGPALGRELGERIDAWLRANADRVQAAQERWFGERQRLDATTHLIDLLARRFAFMPLVAALKAERGLPIEDLAREREVLNALGSAGRRLELPAQPVLDLFALMIELSKAVQRRQREASSLDLGRQIRPALTELGERILQALAEARSERSLAALASSDLELLTPWLTPSEREQLLARLHAIGAR